MVAESVAAARLYLTTRYPYLSSAAWAATLVEREGIGTMAADKSWRIYYDPAFVATLNVRQIAGVLYHELSHLLREHADRRPDGTDHMVWNVAADAEINDDIAAEADIQLPASAVYPKTIGAPDGRLAEEYVDYVKQHATPDCGSGAHGVQQGYEDDEAPGLSPTEASAVRRQTAEAVEQHQRNAGRVPAGLARWAGELLNPVVDWRRELKATMRAMVAHKRGCNDYSYSTPSRRQAVSPNIILPAMVRPDVRVAIIIDTSGSVSEGELGRAVSETLSIMRTLNTAVYLITADADVHFAGRVQSLGAIRKSLLGGGGTDMRVAIERAERIRPQVNAVVIFTDGETPWPAKAPSIPVVVCCTTKAELPSWAKAVRVC